MTDPSRDPLSTFALDVDTGSYTRWRDAVRRGDTPPADEVRVEEFVNYFEQDYARPRDGIGVSIDGARLPFDTGRRIVRVGIQSAAVDESQRPDADLVLVVDCSGSMGDEGKMELAKSSLRMLAGSLRPSDRVAMVCYSTTARVSLEPTRVSEGDAIDHAIDELEPDASTNAEAGLEAGYRLADRMHTSGRMTRVVLISDGVANVGSTTAGGILETIGEHARQGTHLVSVGVGMGTYNDRLLEQLADRGDGWHAYVDTEDEARRVFSEDLAGTLVITGRQAKAQVDFDPEQVAAYRLIGYENRDVADRDFRNDAVDGGEVRAGHSTTALYEVVLRDGSSTTPFARATIRYVDASGATVERDATASARDVGGAIADASPRLVQDLSVAMLADELTGGAWSRRISFSDVGEASSAAARRLPADRDVSELSDLVERLD